MKKELIAKELREALEASQKMWFRGKSHEYIVGHLQGAVESTLRQLEDEKTT